jgi:hypothetical protein
VTDRQGHPFFGATVRISCCVLAGAEATFGYSPAPSVTSLTAGTDEQGRYAFELPPGAYDFEAVAPGQAEPLGRDRHSRCFVLAGGDVEAATITLARGGTLRGTVQGDDGSPLVASITHRLSGSGSVSTVTTSAPDGTFAFADLPEAPAHELAFLAPGHVARDIDDLAVVEGRETTIRVTLQGSGSLEGVVKAPSGEGVHALVHAIAPSCPWTFSEETDARGHFRIDGLPPGETSVFAREWEGDLSCHVKATVAAGETTTIELVVHASQTLAGRVLDGRGRPIEGRTVRVDGYQTRWEQTTDAAGKFSFLLPDVPTYELRVFQVPAAPELVRQVVPDVEAGTMAALDLVLPDEGSIEGTLLAPNGQPVEGWEVNAVPQARSGPAPGVVKWQEDLLSARLAPATERLIARTQPSGSFRFSGLPPGDYWLVVYEPDPCPGQCVAVAAGGHVTDVVLRSGPWPHIRGRLLDPDKKPIGSVSLDFEWQGTTYTRFTSTAEDGSFDLQVLGNGHYSIAVTPSYLEFIALRLGVARARSPAAGVDVTGSDAVLDLAVITDP